MKYSERPFQTTVYNRYRKARDASSPRVNQWSDSSVNVEFNIQRGTEIKTITLELTTEEAITLRESIYRALKDKP